MSKALPMSCILCHKELKPVWDDAQQPDGALYFQGRGAYGSIHDMEPQGSSGYEIYICDECWPAAREHALVYNERLPVIPKIKYRKPGADGQ